MSFTARYRGDCADCDEGISPGDEVDYGADDELRHVDCEDLVITAPPTPPLCGDCFMHHNGECL